jgi:hypothetical protein
LVQTNSNRQYLIDELLFKSLSPDRLAKINCSLGCEPAGCSPDDATNNGTGTGVAADNGSRNRTNASANGTAANGAINGSSSASTQENQAE